jgi:predicted lysophospholipase L1 biosynthesis ABC-type transport system permease subunit
MISRTTKFLSTTAITAALIATVAVARTVHTRTTAADARPAHTCAMGAAPGGMTRPALNGFLACGKMSYFDCEKIETLLPM